MIALKIEAEPDMYDMAKPHVLAQRLANSRIT